MKKTYFNPAIKVRDMQTEELLTNSLNLNSDVTVNGEDALDKGWDTGRSIWDD